MVMFEMLQKITSIYPRIPENISVMKSLKCLYRAKLAESEATVEQLKRRNLRSPHSPIRPSSVNSMSLSLMSSMTSSMGGFEAPVSPEALTSSLLDVARRDVKKMKKIRKRSESQTSSHG